MINPFSTPTENYARRIWLVAGTLIVFGWIGLAWNMNFFIQSRETMVRQDATRMANALQQQVGQTLMAFDLALGILSQHLATHGHSPAEVTQLLHKETQGLPAMLSLLFIDARGIGIAASMADFVPGSSYADREYFRAHAERRHAGTFFGGPQIGKTLARQFIPISRRVESEDGRFLGVLMGAVDPRLMAQVFAEFPVGNNGAISLVHTGTKQIIARTPGHDKYFARDVSATKIFTSGLLDKPNGLYESLTTADSVHRTLAYHQLDAMPFFMLVGYAREDLRDEHRAEILAHGLYALLLAALVGTLSVVLVRAERSRRMKEEKLSKLSAAVEQSPASVVITNLAGEIEYVNRKFTTVTGYTVAEAIGKNPRILKTHLTPLERHTELWAALTAGQPWHGELVNRRKNGEIYWEEASIGPVRKPDGTITHYLAVKEDITQRKQAETVLQEAQAAAEAANLAKSQFLATMSHEIRTPMNGILGMAQMLQMDEVSDTERREYARIIVDSGQTLLTLLNDILDLSKIEAGKLQLSPVACAPENVIADIARLFAEPAAAKSLAITQTWRSSPGQTYLIDPIRLRQMLSNLISNAIKFTPAGQIRIEACEVERNTEEAVLEFAVTDSGIGISAEQQALLFQPFSQVDASATRRFGGTGLGLSIVSRLAELMDGSVGVESAEGQGARFWFRLRVTLVNNHAAMAPRADNAAAPARPLDKARRILIVEDNPTNRLVIEALLKKWQFAYDSVEDGLQAVHYVEQGPRPDLVLMDCQMPVMDGYTATERIRTLERERRLQRLPIVALTADAFESDRMRALASGMDDYLAKPVDVAALRQVIEQWIDRQTSFSTGENQ